MWNWRTRPRAQRSKGRFHRVRLGVIGSSRRYPVKSSVLFPGDLPEERFHRQRPIDYDISWRNLHVQDRYGSGLWARVGFDERLSLRALHHERRRIDVGAEPDYGVAVPEPLGDAHSISVLINGSSPAG